MYKISKEKLQEIIEKVLKEVLNDASDKKTISDADVERIFHFSQIPDKELERQYWDLSAMVSMSGFGGPFMGSDGKILKEDATYTMSIQETAEVMKQKFNLDDWQVGSQKGANGIELMFLIPNFGDNIQLVNEGMEACGWSYSLYRKLKRGNMDWIILSYDPMFQENIASEAKEYETKVLNEKREQIITGYSNIQAIPASSTADGIPFENTVLKYKKDNKYGLMSLEGKEITDAIYDEIASITYKEGMLLVKQDGKYGIININGKIVIKPEYDNITVDNYYDVSTGYQRTGFIVCSIKDEGYRYGYVDYRGKKILDTIYTEIERVTDFEDEKDIYIVAYKDGQAGLLKNRKLILDYEYEDIIYYAYNDVFIVQRNGKQGIADRKGNIKIDTKYTNISFGGIYVNAVDESGETQILDLDGNVVTDGYIAKMPTEDGQHFIVYNEEGIYKIIYNNGNIVVDRSYTNIEEIANNYYIVANNRNNGIIDLTGKSLVELRYNSIVKLDNTELLQANISATSTVSLINKNMQIVVTMDNASIDVEDGYIRLYSETEDKYFDYAGNELSAKDVFPNNTMYAQEENGKWGFVDQNGNTKVAYDYDMVTELNEYGFAGIKKDGKWGVIDENGQVVQEPIYVLDEISPSFIGKYYKVDEWYGNAYYTDKVDEETEESSVN